MTRVERLKSNLQKIHQRIESAAVRAGRKCEEIQLVAVTKYVGAEATRDLVTAGANVLGESRPQLFKEKHEKMSDLNVQWHLIGHLQRNKIKMVLPRVDLIHSVDSLRLLNAIEDAAQKSQRSVDILLEINISGESAKHGFRESELEQVLIHAGSLNSVKVKGLMGMSQFGGTDDDARRQFHSLRKLRDQYLGKFASEQIDLQQLSMGMTGDFEIAIEAGATLVRIGSALFEGVEG